MKWYIPTQSANNHWLESFIPKEKHTFTCISDDYAHDRSRFKSGSNEWRDFYHHGVRTFNAAQSDKDRSGIITFWPQLPAIIGLRNSVTLKKVPILAWSFNVGNLHYGLRQKISKFAFKNVSKFMVYSRDEISKYSEWLDIEPSRFEFVPYHRHILNTTLEEDKSSPYIISLGTAGRDYRLYLEVLEALQLPAIIVTGAHAVAGVKIPKNVKIMSGLTIEQCYELLQKARFSVTPLANQTTASGQVTIIDAMMFSKAQVVSKTPSVSDYLKDQSEALLVDIGDFDGLRNSVERLWHDDQLRNSLAQNAHTRMLNEFSDQAVMPQILGILDSFE